MYFHQKKKKDRERERDLVSIIFSSLLLTHTFDEFHAEAITGAVHQKVVQPKNK